MQTVAAAQANRQFSALLQQVKKGASYQITSRGEPVAVLAPSSALVAASLAKESDKHRAYREWLSEINSRPIAEMPNSQPWTRADLYDRP
jgi:prevent-host-death family protein